MKFRVILASVLAAVLVAGGIGTAAYYSMARPNSTVEVVPVANVNYPDMGYMDYDDMIYGSVTSSVSQNVVLDDEYAVDHIYVTQGEEVTEGTPLFSYDMTLAELELEMKEIELQVQELTLTKLNKELESYRNGTYRESADLEENEDFDDDTLSAAEEFIIEDAESYDDSYADDSADSYSAEPEISYEPDYSDEIIVENDPVISEDFSGSDNSQSADSYDSDSISIEAVEITDSAEEAAVPDSDISETETEKEVPESIQKFETLIDALRSLIDAYEDDLISSDIEDAIVLAVQYYRDNLADEVEGTEESEPKYYVLKSSLEEELSASEYAKLESYVKHMEKYHAYYVDLLIKEAVNASEEDRTEAIRKAREAYDDLSGDAMEYVKNFSALEELESDAGIKTYQKEPEETETETETETESEEGIDEDDDDDIIEEDNDETDTLMEDIEKFCSEAEALLSSSSSNPGEYYDLIRLYWNLCSSKPDIWEDAILRSEVLDLLELDTWDAPSEYDLETLYEDLCLNYVELLVTNLFAEVDIIDSELILEDNLELALDILAQANEDLGKAQEAYYSLGTSWTIAVEKQYQEHLADGNGDDFIISIEDSTKASLEDLLLASAIILSIDDLYSTMIAMLEDEAYEGFSLEDLFTEELVLGNAEILYADYELLTETQQKLIWNIGLLEEILGISEELVYEDETEYDWEDDWYEDWDDWGDDYDYDDDVEQEIIFLEQQIKECELEIKELELEIEQDQRVVDGKVVKSTLNGVVISIGDEDGSSDDEYFAKVSSTSGLYAKGVISELELDTVKIGDLISGVSENDVNFIAEIKEIADYPDPDGSEMSYGSGNSNVSYYPFYALIEDSEDIEEGDAELQLDTSLAESNKGSIYLENYFVRKDSSGQSYVYIADENGLLKKKNVTVGKTYYDYWIEIKSGLKTSDLIAFPYGDNVKDGASTKEVDFLDEGYD